MVVLTVVLSGGPAIAASSGGTDATDRRATVAVDDGTVAAGNLTRIDVRVDVPERTDGIEWLALELANTSRAELAGADFRGPGDGVTHVVSEQYVSLEWSTEDASPDAGEVVLSVFVRGVEPGDATLRIDEIRAFERGVEGTYDVERRNGSLTVTEGSGHGPEEPPAGTIELVAPSTTVAVDGTATLPVEIANATDGLSAAELVVALPDSVRVTDATTPASLSDVNVTRTASGPVVRIGAAGYDEDGPTATVARIRIRGMEPDRTAGAVALEEAVDRNNSRYGVPDGQLPTITVRTDGNGTDPGSGEVPALGGAAGSAGDPDGDGRYEDTNGDGEVTVVDVGALLDGLDSDPVRSNPGAFDYDGNGDVNVLDVATLLDGV